MAIHIDTLIAEVRNSLKQYDSAGLIDDISIIDWTFKALKRFGALLMEQHETVVQIVDGRGTLPASFGKLDLAIKCEKGWIESDLQEDVLQSTLFWKERIEKKDSWDGCKTDCNKKSSEKTIIERVYLHGAETRFNYIYPTLLKLGKHIKKDYFNADCKNLYVKNCPYEITINETTLYTNFRTGNVFIRYLGLELDSQGKPYIPETPLNRLETYLTYHIKRKIFEEIWLNSDDTGLESKIQFLLSQERDEFSLALSDVKASSLSIKSFLKVQALNRRKSMAIEYSIPQL